MNANCCFRSGPMNKIKKHLDSFHLVLIICMIILIITRPTDCTSKPSDNQFVPPKNRRPFMSSEEKRKAYKKCERKMSLRSPCCTAQYYTIQLHPVFLFIRFVLHTEAKLSTALMDGVYMPSVTGTKQKKTLQKHYISIPRKNESVVKTSSRGYFSTFFFHFIPFSFVLTFYNFSNIIF